MRSAGHSHSHRVRAQDRLRQKRNIYRKGPAHRKQAQSGAPCPAAPGALPPPGSAPEVWPDYISIPEPLRAQPIGGAGVSVRLQHLLGYAHVRCLGDLHGKRLADLAAYRNTGRHTIWELRCLIVAALHPGVEPDRTTWPIPLREYRPPEPVMEVAKAIRHLRVRDLPVSAWLARALKRAGVARLEHLHGLPRRRLRALGLTGLWGELETLLRRATAGEFCLLAPEPASRSPGKLLRHLDDLISRLPEQKRRLLLCYYGATVKRRPTLEQLGRRRHVTRAAIGQHTTHILHWLCREGSLKLGARLRRVADRYARSRTPLTPATILAWQDPAHPFRYSPGFYLLLLPKLLSLDISQVGLPRRRSRGAPVGALGERAPPQTIFL